MILLLDINVLLALRYGLHVHHTRVTDWATKLVIDEEPQTVVFATCPITELGFVRIASGKAGYAANVAAARGNLQALRHDHKMIFIPDDRPAHDFPDWVSRSDQTTDGYLLELARCHGGQLATLDRFIPGSLLIPEAPTRPMEVREEAARAEWEALWRAGFTAVAAESVPRQ